MLRFVDTPWSYSALANFEECPRHYDATRQRKTHTEDWDSRASANTGALVHKAMENYITTGDPPPPGLTHFRRIVDRFSTGALQVSTEIRWGLRSDLSPCGFFDNDVCLRVQVDYLALRPDALVNLDYKTSSEPRDDPYQLRLYGLAALQKYPKYTYAYAAFLYTKHHSKTEVVLRDQIPEMVEAVNPRLERLKRAREDDHYPERRNWRCRKFCPVVECRFNGRKLP